MNIKSPDQYVQIMNQIPLEAKKILLDIKQLDSKNLQTQINIRAKRQIVIQKLMEYNTNKSRQSKIEIQQLINDINKTQRHLLKISSFKKQLAERLYNFIDERTEEIERDISQIIPEQLDSDKKRNFRQKKKDPEQFFISEPLYCYCKLHSYGLMVKCENQKCQTQWFHNECISKEKPNLKEPWYCKSCPKNQ